MEEYLLELIKFLKRKRIKYVLSGAFAVGYYAEPRATRDIDLIVQVSEDFGKSLLSSLILFTAF